MSVNSNIPSPSQANTKSTKKQVLKLGTMNIVPFIAASFSPMYPQHLSLSYMICYDVVLRISVVKPGAPHSCSNYFLGHEFLITLTICQITRMATVLNDSIIIIKATDGLSFLENLITIIVSMIVLL